jgi:hypothetical protein
VLHKPEMEKLQNKEQRLPSNPNLKELASWEEKKMDLRCYPAVDCSVIVPYSFLLARNWKNGNIHSAKKNRAYLFDYILYLDV